MSVGLGLWMAQRCVRHRRISGGMRVLLRDFNQWLAEHKQREREPAEFEVLLEEAGFRMAEVARTVLVHGLGLEEDWRAVWRR